MHELSIAISIIEGAEEEAAQHEGRVTAIHLRMGDLSGVIQEALISAFEIARTTSDRLHEAGLVIEAVPGRALEIVALEIEDGT